MWSPSENEESNVFCQHRNDVLAMVTMSKSGDKIQHTHSPITEEKKGENTLWIVN